MLLNITEGAQNVSVENMTSNNVGCLHDYTLTTNDLIKLEKVLIEKKMSLSYILGMT